VKSNEERLTVKKFFIDFIDSTFSFDKGFFFTFWMMLKNPRLVTNAYVSRNKTTFTTPIKFLIVTVSLLVILNLIIEVKDYSMIKVTEDENGEFENLFFSNFERFYNFIMIGVIPLVSLVSWGFFRKEKFNYAENLVISGYVFGLVNSLTFLFIAVSSMFKSPDVYFGNYLNILTFGSLAYFYTRIYDGKWYWNLLKSFAMLFAFFFSLLGLSFLIMLKVKLFN